MRKSAIFFVLCCFLTGISSAEIRKGNQAAFSIVNSSNNEKYDSKVEYLESTGTQYIDTEVLVTSTTRIRAIASCATTVNGFLFGSSYANSTYITYIGAQYYSGIGLRVFCGRAASNYNHSRFVAGTAYLYEIDNANGAISIDGSIVKKTGTSGGIGGIIYAFCDNPLTNYSSCKIYSIQIWNNNIIVRDFIPVRFTNERGVSEGAMYDNISGQLFCNRGSGQFIIGPDRM